MKRGICLPSLRLENRSGSWGGGGEKGVGERRGTGS